MIRIITDSAADYGRYKNSKELTIIPLTITIDDDSYQDCVTISPDDFYKKINVSKEFPKTSQPSPQLFYEAMKEGIDAGDEVLVITISSSLSGTYGSANIAKKMFEDSINITIFDSLQCTMGQRILVDHALEMIKDNKGVPQIIKKLKMIREKIVFIAYLDDLSYVVKGGRLSKREGILGSLIHVKPLVNLGEDGKVSIFKKSFGKVRAFTFIKKNFELEPINKEYPVYTTYTDSNKNLVKLKTKIDSFLSGAKVVDGQFGPTIGTYVGKEGLGIFYIKK